MDIQVNGKQIDVGEALSTHVRDRLSERVNKYFDKATNAHVTFSPEAHMIRVDCSVHAGHGIVLQSHGETNDPYTAFDQALDRVETRLRRYKRRLTNHHHAQKDEMELLSASSYILAGEDEETDEPDDLTPIVIAETRTDVPTTTVGGAVMRMDLAGAPVQMFKNSAHGGLNVVYRRADGNIGWIDPQE